MDFWSNSRLRSPGHTGVSGLRGRLMSIQPSPLRTSVGTVSGVDTRAFKILNGSDVVPNQVHQRVLVLDGFGDIRADDEILMIENKRPWD